jgi:serine/threonine protein kinase
MIDAERSTKEKEVLKHLAHHYRTVEFTSSSLHEDNRERVRRHNNIHDDDPSLKQPVQSQNDLLGSVNTAASSTNQHNNQLSSSNIIFGTCTNVSERYEKLNRIGEGTYGAVYRARDKVSNCTVALKRCFPHHEASDGFPVTTLREISVLRECCGNSYIVNLREVAVSSNRSGIFLVFDYYEHDLGELIDAYYATHQKSPFRQEAQVKRLLLQLLSALKFLHQRRIVHRDIKMSNLLYQQTTGRLKVADFGLARRITTERQGYDATHLFGGKWKRRRTVLTPKVVSLWYRPPEVLLGSDTYDETCDTWSAGCVFAELLSGTPLIRGKNEMDQIKQMFELLGRPDKLMWPSLMDMPLVREKEIDLTVDINQHKRFPKILDDFSYLSTAGLSLLSQLLTYDFKRRLTAAEGLESEYFKEDPFPTEESSMPKFPIKHNRRK